jgi:hypothetical protein
MQPFSMISSTSRAAINAANAQFSTGPKTEQGKLRASLNALRHGLTSQLEVLPSEDPEQYQQHLASFQRDLRPFGADEQNLVQILADTSWRLHRVAALEANLLTTGTFTGEPSTADPGAMTDRMIKGLATLSLHGHRLSRQFQTTLTQLKQIQRERIKLNDNLAKTINFIKDFEKDGYLWDPAESGFVFRRPEPQPEQQRVEAESAPLPPLEQVCSTDLQSAGLS